MPYYCNTMDVIKRVSSLYCWYELEEMRACILLMADLDIHQTKDQKTAKEQLNKITGNTCGNNFYVFDQYIRFPEKASFVYVEADEYLALFQKMRQLLYTRNKAFDTMPNSNDVFQKCLCLLKKKIARGNNVFTRASFEREFNVVWDT